MQTLEVLKGLHCLDCRAKIAVTSTAADGRLLPTLKTSFGYLVRRTAARFRLHGRHRRADVAAWPRRQHRQLPFWCPISAGLWTSVVWLRKRLALHQHSCILGMGARAPEVLMRLYNTGPQTGDMGARAPAVTVASWVRERLSLLGQTRTNFFGSAKGQSDEPSHVVEQLLV